MEHGEAMDRMREIQRIMERTTLYTLLPGMPAIIGGLLALTGCVVSYLMIRSLNYSALILRSLQVQWWFCIMWTVIGIAAIAQEVVLTARAAKKQGIEPIGRAGLLAGFSLTPSVLVAMVLTVTFLLDFQIQYIAPVWMMCYGTGVYAAGLFSLRLPRLLGLAFLLTGTIGMLFLQDYDLLLTAFSFGLLHIIFGVVVILKRRQGGQS